MFHRGGVGGGSCLVFRVSEIREDGPIIRGDQYGDRVSFMAVRSDDVFCGGRGVQQRGV